MSEFITKRLRSAAIFPFVTLIALSMSFSASGGMISGTINIQATDQEITYQDDGGGVIFDTPDLDGGNLNPTDADLLNAVQFNFNGNAPPLSGGNNVFVSSAGTGYYGDFLVNGVGATIPISNTTVSTIGGGGPEFGFDLFSSSTGTSTPILRLHFNSVNVLLNSGVLLISGKADVVDQNMPFLLSFDTSQQVDFAYTATGPGISGTATDASLFIGGGTINISGAGIQVPEPMTHATLTTALAVGLLHIRRRFARGRT